MAATDVWEQARVAMAERRWRAACELFAEAAASDAAGLGAGDMELHATALYLRGRTDESFEALAAAHEAFLEKDDLVGAARTAGWLAIEALEAGDPSLSSGWVARGLRLVERSGDAGAVGGLVALVPAALAAMFVGDLDEARRRFEGIASVAERNEDRELAAHAALGQGICLITGGRTEEGFAHLDDVMAAVTAEQVSPVTTCLTYRIVLNLAHQSFDLDRAAAWTSEFARWCAGQPELVAYIGQSHSYRARLALIHGEWAVAAAAATQAEESLRAGDFTAMYVANYELAELHRLRGEFRPAEEHYARAGSTGWEAQPGLGLLRLATGDTGQAQAMMRRSVGGADDGRRRFLLPAMIEAELAVGDVAAARRATDELSDLDKTRPTPLLSAVTRYADALVRRAEGDLPGALDAAESARTAWLAIGAPYAAARCGLVLAQVLLALGDDDAAAVERDAARSTFLALGARPALGELAAATGGPSAGTLTAREAEVLRLVSTGLTNRGIATRLSLSEKTVARHLSNIFGKLGLSTRAAATAYAYEHGLV